MKTHELIMRCGAIGVMFVLVIGGCACAPSDTAQSAATIKAEVLSGFGYQPSRLFVSNGRLHKLASALGYDSNEYSYYCDHSSDGTSVRLWNYDRTSAVIINKGQQARVISTPPRAFLDDRNDVVAWYGESAEDNKVTFNNGGVLFAPNFSLDSSGRFFCYGGRYYDYAAKTKREMPICIAAVSQTEKPLAMSRIRDGLLEGIYVTKHAVYIMARTWRKGEVRNDLVCEEYTRGQDSLVFRRQFELRSPAKVAAVNFVPEDFDSESCSFLLSVSRDLRFGTFMKLRLLGFGRLEHSRATRASLTGVSLTGH